MTLRGKKTVKVRSLQMPKKSCLGWVLVVLGSYWDTFAHPRSSWGLHGVKQ